jgi:hypothetical protein
MRNYIDLCDSQTFDSIYEALTNFWIEEKVLDFAFWIYGRNEETLENILYYYWIDEEELLEAAGIETETETEEEEE